jgi:hypothetical protein
MIKMLRMMSVLKKLIAKIEKDNFLAISVSKFAKIAVNDLTLAWKKKVWTIPLIVLSLLY